MAWTGLTVSLAMAAIVALTSCGGASDGSTGVAPSSPDCNTGAITGSGGSGRSAPTFQISGFFTGLSQGEVTISNGLDQIRLCTQNDGVIRDIPFSFNPGLPTGAGYDIKIERADASVSCEVLNGSGVVSDANITNIVIQCFSTPALRLLAGRIPKPDVDGIAANIAFSADALAVSKDGYIYIGSDGGLGLARPLLRRITPNGFLTTIAGDSPGLPRDGTGNEAHLIRPRGLTPTLDGNFLFGDKTAVRRVTPAGVVTTIAGSLAEGGSEDTPPDEATPDPLSARFLNIDGLALSQDGKTVYVLDGSGTRIRTIKGGRVSTLRLSATSNFFHSIAVGLDDVLYVGDGGAAHGNVYRVGVDDASGDAQLVKLPGKVTPVFAIVPESRSTLIAIGADFGEIVRFYTDGKTPAVPQSSDTPDLDFGKCLDGRLKGAQFATPRNSAFLSPGRLLISDPVCQGIRLADLDAGTVSTPYGTLGFGTADGRAAQASFHGLSGIAYNGTSREVMTSEAFGLLVRAIDSDGVVRTLAGDPTANQAFNKIEGPPGIDGTGASATFGSPEGMALDALGNAYVLDHAWGELHDSVRKIEPNGRVTTIRSDVPEGNGGRASNRLFLAFEPCPPSAQPCRLLTATANSIWRFGIDSSVPIERVAGTDTPGSQDGSALGRASFDAPAGLALDKAGAIYVADSGNGAIRKISNGTVETIARGLRRPVALALTDKQDFLLVLDTVEFVVRAIDLRPGAAYSHRVVVGTSLSSRLLLGPLPGSLAPPYNNNDPGSALASGGWDISPSIAVGGSRLYIALGDVVLEADLALH